ncbi:MAG: ABC transporter ATP-binding protein [Spirochaetales bacterium]|nr:ABC transporter ATP-binding protein [Spirochaetales bacterium]
MSDILNLSSLFVKDKRRYLLRDISFSLGEETTLVFIGESGSGKTMTLKSILGILPEDTEVEKGSVTLMGRDILSISEKEKRRLLCENVGFVPQNTVNYLHPLLRISDQITDGYTTLYGKKTLGEAMEKATRLLESVGITDPERVLSSYPSLLSGGMKQRVNIASALMNDPSLLISDEPTSALDKVVQKQVSELYIELKKKRRMSLVVVSHDIVFVKKIADVVAVFYAGEIVEIGKSSEIFSNPLHPYTKALISLSPSLMKDKSKPLGEIKGYITEEDRRREGCPFYSRCPERRKECMNSVDVRKVSETHSVRCVL